MRSYMRSHMGSCTGSCKEAVLVFLIVEANAVWSDVSGSRLTGGVPNWGGGCLEPMVVISVCWSLGPASHTLQPLVGYHASTNQSLHA